MRFSFRHFQRSAAAAITLTASLCFGAYLEVAQASEAPTPADKPLSIFAPQPEEPQSDSKPSRRDFDLPDRPNSMGDLFGGNRNMGPAPAPRPRPQPQRKSQRSILDDPGNWGFITTEDVVQEYKTKVNGQTPVIMKDGRDWNTLSPVERYYERQMRGRSTPAPESASEIPSFGRTPGFNEFSPVIFSSPSDSSIRPVTSGGFSQPTQNEALSDLLGFRNNPFSPEAIRQREANNSHMEAFRRALDVQPHQTAGAANPAAATPTAGFNPTTSGSLNNPFGLSAGAANPYLSSVSQAGPEAPQAPTAPMAPGQYATPMPTPTRMLPQRPDFSLPQRRF